MLSIDTRALGIHQYIIKPINIKPKHKLNNFIITCYQITKILTKKHTKHFSMTIRKSKKQPVNIYRELTDQEEQTRDYLLLLPLFDSFKGDEIDILARYMNYSMVHRGEYLFTEGDKGDHMCFVVSGLLEVLKKSTQGDYRVIARLGKGHTIGEMSIIDKAPRSASVIARQGSIIIILTYKAVDLLSKRHPLIMVNLLKKIMRLLSLNMRRTSSWLADTMPI